MDMGVKNIVIPRGQTYTDTIEAQFPLPNFFVTHCQVSTRNIGGRLREVTISSAQSNPNYVGPARAFAQYVDNLRPYYIEYKITFSPSVITTSDDFVTFSGSDPVVVRPVANDVSTASGLSLRGLAFVQGGQATMEADSITFTPNDDANEGYVLYSVQDDEGTSMNGTIYFIRSASDFPSSDTISLAVKNTLNKRITLPADGFILFQDGLLGSADSLHSRVYEYNPSFPQTGTDTLIFSHSNGHHCVYILDVTGINANTSSVRDDVVFTPKNTSVTFDVLANDLAFHFSIINYSPELVRDTLGVFTYTPPSQFSGIKNFTYTVRYSSNYTYTGKITIYVGNYKPNENIDYEFSTIKNKSLVVNYDMPIEGYHFELLNNPLFGTVELFDNQTVEEDCNEFWSKTTLIYTPDNNYYGQDSFDIQYCVVNNGCVVYKVYVEILDSDLDTLCLCQGPGCVWKGDFNGDGIVSVRDVLALGRYMGLSGPERVDSAWPARLGQISDDWALTQLNGYNIKHIDADGDGLISEEDADAIDEYYGVHHRFVPQEVLGSKEIDFILENDSEEYEPGDLAVIDIVLGSEQSPAIDVFGLVFGLNINPSVLDSASLDVVFDSSSWLTKGDGQLQLFKQPQSGQVEAALTKVSSIVVDELEGFRPGGGSGHGVIGQLVFIVVDELEGFRSSDDYYLSRIYARDIEMEDKDGFRFKLPDSHLDIKINRNLTDPEPTEDKLILYPNPAQNHVILHFNGRNIIYGYTVFDAMGQRIEEHKNLYSQSENINTSALPDGMYIVQVTTSQGTISKKLYVAHKK